MRFSCCLSLFVLFVFAGAVQVEAQDSKPQWYKGNLHTHSLWSDGNDFPDMIVRWYVQHDYQFLALTDHNILSNGEKWMALETIKKRGGDKVLEKYIKAFGKDWVETRENKSGKQVVRLRTFAECRKKFDKDNSFMLMTGEEISDRVGRLPLHLNATNLKKLLRPTGGSTIREAMTRNLRAAKDQAEKENREILVHLNHPNFGWAVTAEDIAAVTDEKFFEVYNGHPGVNHLGDKNHPSVERIWDIANTIRVGQLDAEPLMGMVTDDCHNYHGKPGSQPGRGWIMVRSRELSSKAILRAVNAGDFYGSSGVKLKDFSWDPKTKRLTIEIEPEKGIEYKTQFIGTAKGYDKSSKPRLDKNGKPTRSTRIYSSDIGKVFATKTGNKVHYQLTGNELYVRATVTSSKKHPNPSFADQMEQAWIQPVGWKK